ncbi:MAG: diguanylate cyclase [Pseudomonadales bacterium]
MSASGWLLLPPIAGAAIGLCVSWFAARRRPGRGWRQLIMLGIGSAWWCLGQVAWLQAVTESQFMLINRIQYVGITLVPVFWAWFVLAQTARLGWLRPPRVLLFLVLPATILLVVFGVLPGREAIWRGVLVPPEVPVARNLYGPLFWVVVGHGYLLIGGGCVLLIGRYLQSPHYRRQLMVTGIVPLLLMVMNLLFVSGKWPLPTDPTPLCFAIAFALILWAMIRHRMYDLVPLGRGIAFDSLQEGVLLLDEHARIVDANPAACALLSVSPQSLIGQSAHGVLSQVDAADLIRGRIVEPAAVDLNGRTMQLGAAPIQESASGLFGAVVTFRDVTRELAAQSALLQARERLEAANRELERIAHTDELTGLANRRLLFQRLEEEIALSRRNGRGLGLLLIDLDHFKAVNDRHGHLVGDAVLQGAGRALRAVTRHDDLAARYGGEEFALLLVETNAVRLSRAAQRVWTVLRERTHTTDSGAAVRVTVSVGCALLERSDTGGDDLVARADAALYEAKRDGRDRICVAGMRADGAEAG